MITGKKLSDILESKVFPVHKYYVIIPRDIRSGDLSSLFDHLWISILEDICPRGMVAAKEKGIYNDYRQTH